jgi:hypothetical protein
MKLSINNLNKEQRDLDDAWATMIKARDNWCCVICGSDYRPSAHHIIPRENRETRYDEWNGLTLCTKHHKFCRIISAHNNPFAFFLWLQFYKPDSYYRSVKSMRSILKTHGIDI